MKQLTDGRSILSGFSIAFGRAEARRRMFDSLRPEGGFIPLDLEMNEVVAELDPGMVDWQHWLLDQARTSQS